MGCTIANLQMRLSSSAQAPGTPRHVGSLNHTGSASGPPAARMMPPEPAAPVPPYHARCPTPGVTAPAHGREPARPPARTALAARYRPSAVPPSRAPSDRSRFTSTWDGPPSPRAAPRLRSASTPRRSTGPAAAPGNGGPRFPLSGFRPWDRKQQAGRSRFPMVGAGWDVLGWNKPTVRPSPG